MASPYTRARYLAATAWSLLIFAWVPQHASAGSESAQSTQLAAIERQLDTIDQLAAQSEQLSDAKQPGVYFDYARLHADISRVRQGIQDYLSPPRPLPRDPSTLVGQYRVRTPTP